jgi:hypothetical protein
MVSLRGWDMLITLQGSYENGVIKLDEIPAGIKIAKAIVILMPRTESDVVWEGKKMSDQVFSEWGNDVDSIYDAL